MTSHEPVDQGERYDRIALGYQRWWAPVLVRDAEATLDLVAPDVEAALRAGDAPAILDLGTGTGTLAVAALRRWPGVNVTAIDASGEMLELAEAEAEARLSPAAQARLTTYVAYADDLPFADGAFDLVVSSFVLQLVPNRIRALREARRVLRPGGRLASTTWLAGGKRFEGDRVFDAVLDELGIRTEDAEEPGDPHEISSVRAASDGLRRAGFRQARARAGMLEHQFTPEGYVGFLAEFDEEDLFAGLVGREREALESRLLERLAALPPDDLVLRAPIVTATGVNPG